MRMKKSTDFLTFSNVIKFFLRVNLEDVNFVPEARSFYQRE